MRSVLRVNLRALSTDVLVSGTLGFAGDIACQQLIERNCAPHDHMAIDWQRCTAVTAFNSVYIGGFLHVLYKTYPRILAAATSRISMALSKTASAPIKDGSLAQSIGCALVDNIQCGLIYIPAYFIGVGALQSQNTSDSIELLMQEWRAVYVSCSVFWIPYMAANFALM